MLFPIAGSSSLGVNADSLNVIKSLHFCLFMAIDKIDIIIIHAWRIYRPEYFAYGFKVIYIGTESIQ